MKSKIFLYITIFLTLFSINSCSDDETFPDPAASFTADKTTARVGEFVQFTNTSEDATAFRWSFGDGTTSSEISPRKSYEATGVYTVSLVSTGKGGSIISSSTITIVPDALFEIEGSDHVVFAPVKFNSLSKGATSYEWDFGNAGNSTSTEENPEFIYTVAGTFTVTLTAISAEGESTFERQITINPSPSADIYFIEYGADPIFIRRLSLDGSGTVSNFLDINDKSALNMAYNSETGKIYFTDNTTTEEGKVWSVNIDGTGLTEIASGMYEPYGIAVDEINNKVYWVDEADGDDIGHIYRANLDGSNLEMILEMEGVQFRAIALDPENNKMYFQEVYYENVHVANLDGTNESVLIEGIWGYGIYVDTVNDKLYYDEWNSEELRRSNLDGTNEEVVDVSGSRVYGITVDHETSKLYWSARDTGSIYESNLDGSGKVAVKSGLSSPRGIFLRK
jgi:PKD repeat protein